MITVETQQYVLSLDEVGSNDTALVGGKSANLGELADLDVPVLPGYTTTAAAFDRYVASAGLNESISTLLDGLDPDDVADLQERGQRIRDQFEAAKMPADVEGAILEKYRQLASETGMPEPVVAVRSSATAEDLPEASFAGQQETFLDVSGEEELITAVKGCYASLFTDRAITYRADREFDHTAVKVACVIQSMGRADLGCSGIAFTIDPDTGFRNAVVIEASYGLGELIVQGQVIPDRYVIFKPTNGIIERRAGSKERRMVRGNDGTVVEPVPPNDRDQLVLSDKQVTSLATYAKRIEDYFSRPMDIEWLLDGERDELFIKIQGGYPEA